MSFVIGNRCRSEIVCVQRKAIIVRRSKTNRNSLRINNSEDRPQKLKSGFFFEIFICKRVSVKALTI